MSTREFALTWLERQSAETKASFAWLEQQSREANMCYALRAALRFLPNIAVATPALVLPTELFDKFALFVFRGSLVGSVGSFHPNEYMEPSVVSASRRLRWAVDIVAGPPSSAASCTLAAIETIMPDSNWSLSAASTLAPIQFVPDTSSDQDVKLAYYQACNKDADTLENSAKGVPVFDIALWHHEGMPVEVAENYQALLRFWQSDPKVWDFWERWYNGFLNGTPMDWDIQLAVASLPDEDWEKGPEWVAGKIAEIEAEFLSKSLPQAETIEFSTETGKFFVVPVSVAKPDLLAATLSQIEDALEDITAAGSNGIHERSWEYTVLTRTIRKYGNDPQRIEMDLTSVYRGIARQIADDELPASEENLALQNALREGAQGIRATHPDIAKNRELLTRQALAELTDDQKETLAIAQPMLEDISEGQLREDWPQDIPLLSEDHHRVGPPVLGPAERNEILAGYAEKVRVFGRIAKIVILLKSTPDLVKKLEATATVKIASMLAIFTSLVQVGLSLF